jgi:hypothetical protein
MKGKIAKKILKMEKDKLMSEPESDRDWELITALNTAIEALEKDKCSSCKHYDKDYGETCLNPEGTCRVFEYDGYEEET